MGDVDGEEDILDGDRVSVLEERVRANVEDPGLGVVRVVGGGDGGGELTVLVDGEESFGDDLRDVVVDDARLVGGIQGGQ